MSIKEQGSRLPSAMVPSNALKISFSLDFVDLSLKINRVILILVAFTSVESFPFFFSVLKPRLKVIDFSMITQRGTGDDV